MRELSELADVPDPAWPALTERLAESRTPLECLPADPAAARACLLQLQITTRSWLGSLVLNCGGLLLDGGWLRVYAGGSPRLPGLARVNGFPAEFDPGWQAPGGLVVAHDVLGGVFALNGIDPAASGRPGQPGEVIYFAPDALRWEALDVGHGDWLVWLLTGPLDDFYGGLRWPGWRTEIAGLRGDQGISVVPFPWSAEAQRDMAATSRRRVPLLELLDLGREFSERSGEPAPGFLGVL
ncbi:DUF2625 family protein [Spirillospora sp. NPDC127200]